MLGLSLWLLKSIAGLFSSSVLDSELSICCSNMIGYKFRVFIFKQSFNGWNLRCLPWCEKKRIQCRLLFMHVVPIVRLQLPSIVLHMIFHQFGHYYVPDKINVIFMLKMVECFIVRFSVFSELLICIFFQFLTEPCSFCVTMATFLQILTNHCSTYIISFELRLIIVASVSMDVNLQKLKSIFLEFTNCSYTSFK